MNIKEAAEAIEKEKKELQSQIDRLLIDFEAKSGIKLAALQLMRMAEYDSKNSTPFVFIILEL